MIPILKTIETADLVPHPCNRTIETTGDEWGSFLQSIRANGILTPLHVRPLGDGYQILAGHRRHAAAQLVGLSVVACIVEEMDYADAMAFLVNENLQRSDLTPVDEAMFCRRMQEDLELSESQIAERISRSIH